MFADTIAAQATPPGKGGVGIIRISGPKALAISYEILEKNIKPRLATFSKFFAKDKKIIDYGVAIYFPQPQSYTGEDVVELQGHGGQVIMDLLLRRVLELGARLAQPGEFTQRAFLNHKLDLVQVEAMADLINATTDIAAQNAQRSLQGEFSQKIQIIADLILELRSYLEATIDFTEEEEIEKINTNFFSKKTDEVLCKLQALQSSAKQGVILREGITVVITGDTNAGKSSLLNYLSGQETAIVTDIPGTTRDVLRTLIQIDGIPINLLDTAGMHDKPDVIEVEGIRRAWEEIKKGDHVLLMVDAATNKKGAKELSADFLKVIPPQNRFSILYNKIDLLKEEVKIINQEGIDCIYLSVKEQKGLALLKKHLKESAGLNDMENGFSARRRHLEALEQAKSRIQNIVASGLLGPDKIELVAEELKMAQNILGEITGKTTTTDLLNKIFAEFCIGK